MKRFLLLAVLCKASLAAIAQDAQALHVRALAATCAQCHGTDGQGVAAPALPRLAGMPRDEMLRKLRDLQTGAQRSTVMGQLARGYSDAQLAQLASFFAAQK